MRNTNNSGSLISYLVIHIMVCQNASDSVIEMSHGRPHMRMVHHVYDAASGWLPVVVATAMLQSTTAGAVKADSHRLLRPGQSSHNHVFILIHETRLCTLLSISSGVLLASGFTISSLRQEYDERCGKCKVMQASTGSRLLAAFVHQPVHQRTSSPRSQRLSCCNQSTHL